MRSGESVPTHKKFDVFMDGGCAFCQWARARIEPFDTDERLNFLDYNDPAVAEQAPFSRDALDREIHVRAPDGAWHAGFAAWVVLLRAMPFLKWLGALLGSSMFRNFGPKLYRWVARNRHRLPGSPPACRTHPAPTAPLAQSHRDGKAAGRPRRAS
jgi:predicted DCC family thiol-disulfide oxidoreductase YuxK